MKRRPIFYDTETTGIKTDRDRIIEIAAYDPERNATFVKLVNPGMLIPPDATAIHNITNEMVSQADPFRKVGEEFVQFCSGDVVLIAHNNDAFDLPFLKNEFARHQVTFPEWKFFDTLKWSRRYRPDLPKHSLQFLREIYGIEANNAHRALDDVIVLHKVFCHMTGDLSIDEVYNLINATRTLQHMPFGKHQGQPLQSIPKDYLKWLAGSGAFDKPENNELRTSLEKLGMLTPG